MHWPWPCICAEHGIVSLTFLVSRQRPGQLVTLPHLEQQAGLTSLIGSPVSSLFLIYLAECPERLISPISINGRLCLLISGLIWPQVGPALCWETGRSQVFTFPFSPAGWHVAEWLHLCARCPLLQLLPPLLHAGPGMVMTSCCLSPAWSFMASLNPFPLTSQCLIGRTPR